jgi:hypothetical protein
MLMYTTTWKKNLKGMTKENLRPKSLKLFAEMNKDDEPYRAMCRRSTVFAKKIKDFSDSEDEGKRLVPF